MEKNNQIAKKLDKGIPEKDVDALLKQVREFQIENQKYLIKTPDVIPDVKPTIINMVNTNN